MRCSVFSGQPRLFLIDSPGPKSSVELGVGLAVQVEDSIVYASTFCFLGGFAASPYRAAVGRTSTCLEMAWLATAIDEEGRQDQTDASEINCAHMRVSLVIQKQSDWPDLFLILTQLTYSQVWATW